MEKRRAGKDKMPNTSTVCTNTSIESNCTGEEAALRKPLERHTSQTAALRRTQILNQVNVLQIATGGCQGRQSSVAVEKTVCKASNLVIITECATLDGNHCDPRQELLHRNASQDLCRAPRDSEVRHRCTARVKALRSSHAGALEVSYGFVKGTGLVWGVKLEVIRLCLPDTRINVSTRMLPDNQ